MSKVYNIRDISSIRDMVETSCELFADNPAFLSRDGETVYVKKLSVSRPDRALVRARAAQAALELALRLAQGKVPAGTEPLARDAQHSAEALDKLDEVFLGH